MTRVAVIVCFLTAFVAGLLVGRQTRQVAITTGSSPSSTQPADRSPRGGPAGWLVRELNLDGVQQKDLEKIWSQTARMGGREREDRRRQLRRERDEAIAALVRPEDYGKYDQILKQYFDQTDAIDREMKTSFDAAVEKTRLILTSEQRAKYEELLKRHQPPDHDGRGSKDRGSKAGGRDSSNRRGDSTSATSRPAAVPHGVPDGAPNEVAPL
ncbi:MAG: hypothetical protein ABIP55_04590 [Tepidisphaeraceae bacterium]